MKVLLNLTNDTLEYQDTKVFIQGTDARNQIIVYADEDITFTNLTIAYQLQNGRTTIAMANSGLVDSESDDYIDGYTGYIFNVPLSVTTLTGNIMATVVANISGAKHKFNVLNTVIDSVFFEAYETALEEAEAEFASDIQAMQSAITQLQGSKADKTTLNAEIARATAKEGELETAIGNETTARIADVDAEELRATAKENEIAGDLATETQRATLAEGLLLERIQTEEAAREFGNRIVDGRLNKLENQVGYVELSNTSGTLTDTQYAEILKPNCIIKFEDFNFLGKSERDGLDLYFKGYLLIENQSSYVQIQQIYVKINLSNKSYQISGNQLNLYNKSQTDIIVNAAGHKIVLTIDSDFKLQAILKDKNNNTISSSNVIDLPLESVVVSGSYDAVNKKVILTLQDGSTIEFSVADLINGLQEEITANNPLSSDLVDDTNQVHKFVSASDITNWNNKFDKSQIGYIELSSNSGTLTQEQYSEISKDVAFIRSYISGGDRLYYKSSVNTNTKLILFISCDVYANVSTYVNLSQKGILINSETLSYSIIDYILNLNVYNKNQTDNLLANSVNDCKAYTDKKIEDLAWVLGGNTLDVETDTTTAYQKSVPSGVYNPNGTPKALLNVIGCMSYQINQLVQNGNFVNADGWSSYIYGNSKEISNNECHIYGLTNLDISKATDITNGHKYFICYDIKGNSSSKNTYLAFSNNAGSSSIVSLTTSYQTISGIITAQVDANRFYIYCTGNDANNEGWIKNVMLFDLTDMGITANDVATATSELLKRGIDINTYQPYFTGIRDSAVTSVVSKDSNDTTIDTYTIPAEIQALEGYGYGINDNCYNYIDFDSKKFIENDKRILGSSLTGWRRRSDVSGKNTFSLGIPNVYKYISTVKALSSRYTFSGTIQGYVDMANKDDMTFCLYQTGSTTSADCMIYINDSSCSNASELETAIANETFDFEIDTIETDISQYIDNNFIEVEENGTLTFNNTYEQSVPSDIDFLVKEVKA